MNSCISTPRALVAGVHFFGCVISGNMNCSIRSSAELMVLSVLLLLGKDAHSQQAFATVIIGRQEWMAENLAVDHYADGVPIPEAKTAAQWKAHNENKTGCYTYYDSEPLYGKLYGKIYNWYAVKRGLAPHCWRLATRADFERLVANYGEAGAAKKLKATHSWNNDWSGDNKSGFGGYASGCRNDKGTYSYIGRKAFWWTFDVRKLSNGKETGLVFSIDSDDKLNYDNSEDFGFFVRCVREAGAAAPLPCP